MPYLKQSDVKGNGKQPKKSKTAKTNDDAKTPSVPTGTAHVSLSGMSLGGIEYALEELASHVGRFTENAVRGQNKLAVFTGEEGAGYYPVLIALDPCSETTESMLAVGERIATAFERIADALTGKQVTPMGSNG